MLFKPPQGGGTDAAIRLKNATFIICRPLRGLDEHFLPFSTGSTRGYVPPSPAGIKDTKITISLNGQVKRLRRDLVSVFRFQAIETCPH